MIQAHHRYAMVPPSIHPDLGTPYRLIDQQSGEMLEQIPEPDDLPALPWSWIEGLKGHKSMLIGDAATPGDARRFLDEHDTGTRLGALDDKTHAASDMAGRSAFALEASAMASA
jgi:hypothetical protein